MDQVPTTPQPTQIQSPPASKSRKKIILIIAAALVVVLVAGAALYAYKKSYLKAKDDIAKLQGNAAWQQKQINDLDSRIRDLFGEVVQLGVQLNTGDSAAYTDDYKPVNADVTIEGTTTYVPTGDSALTNPAYKLLLVDVLARNNNAEEAYFSSADLKLKDTEDHEYNAYYGSSDLDLPGGRVSAEYFALKPGEQSRGTLVYLVTRNVNSLILSNINTGKTLKTISL